jgi:uridine kinase
VTTRKVIAISGPSGAGKTTLIQRVVTSLPHAVAVYFDDFTASHQLLPDPKTWIESGCDCALWRNPAFAQHIRQLKVDGTADDASGSTLAIVIEEPFGRTRPEMQDLIDYVVLVEIPPDIALARVLQRYFRMSLRHESPEDFLVVIEEHLKNYETINRPFYDAVTPRLRPDCNLLVDGMLPIDTSAKQIVEALLHQFPSLSSANG